MEHLRDEWRKLAMPRGRPYLLTNHDELRVIVPDFPVEFEARVDGDCGPIAIAALAGVSYSEAVELATEAGFRPGVGMKAKDAAAVIAQYRTMGRFTRQMQGTPLRDYLTKRSDWTGLVLVKDRDGAHLIAVVRGYVFNGLNSVSGGSYEDADVIATQTVLDWTKVKRSTAFATNDVNEGEWHHDVDTPEVGKHSTTDYYVREMYLRAAGMPYGQVFTSASEATKYARSVMRDYGIAEPLEVFFVSMDGGDSNWLNDRGEGVVYRPDRRLTARIRLGTPVDVMHTEHVILHEVAHLIHRTKFKHSNHGPKFAAIHAELLHRYMGVGLSMWAARRGAAWYHEHETQYRLDHNMTSVDRVKESKTTLNDLLQRILKQYGVPRADEAYVYPNPSGDWGSSVIGWDTEVGLTPVVFLGDGMYDKLTVCHEAAHHVDKFRKGTMGQRGDSVDSAHNSDWLALFIEILARYLPEVSKELGPKLRRGS